MDFGSYAKFHTFDWEADSEKAILRNFEQQRAVISKLSSQRLLLLLFPWGTKFSTKSTLLLPTGASLHTYNTNTYKIQNFHLGN